MKVTENASLTALNTFGVDARAGLRIDIESEEDVLTLPALDPSRDLLLGGGSNVLLVSDIPGTVYLNRISGREVIERGAKRAVVEVGAGENWHDLVIWCLQQGLTGLENLSLIPGRVGAAPIQNIGAYGVELSSSLISVTAWDWQAQKWRIFKRNDCQFGYRDSRFKTTDSDRFLISSLRLGLCTEFTPHLEYADLAQAFGATASTALTAQQVSDAVIRIRLQKLPDPARIGNAGSFFKNPLITAAEAQAIKQDHPQIPRWSASDGFTKLSAAWLIERCGFKGYAEGSAGVSDQHALVVVNNGGATGAQLWALACRVRETVKNEFGIQLQPEPRIVNFSNS